MKVSPHSKALCHTPFTDPKVVSQIAKISWPYNHEELRVGEIPLHQINVDLVSCGGMNLYKFITSRSWEVPPDKWNPIGDSQAFYKMMWLASEYLEHKSFQSPLCVHYNPRLQKNVVHPGHGRATVMNYLEEDLTKPTTCLYFNTGGTQPDFWDDLGSVEVDDLIVQGWDINLVPDHGSMIPHCNYEGTPETKIVPNAGSWHRKIYQDAQTEKFKIYLPHEQKKYLSGLEFFLTQESKKATVCLDFNCNPDPETVAKAVLLCFIEQSWHTSEFTINKY